MTDIEPTVKVLVVCPANGFYNLLCVIDKTLVNFNS